MLFVLSFIGAVGLAARGTSRSGKGLCVDLADVHPEWCTEAAVAIAFAWIAVVVGTSSRSSAPCLVGLTGSLAGGGLAASFFDKSPRRGWYNPRGSRKNMKKLELLKQSSFSSSRSPVLRPTPSYIRRPGHPYDLPRRKRSTRSQPSPRRVASNREPVPPVPLLPPFHEFDRRLLGEDLNAPLKTDRRQGKHTPKPDLRKELEGLPELPPPVRRPPKDPRRIEMDERKYLSGTDVFANCG
jgi:hypothetical protein